MGSWAMRLANWRRVRIGNGWFCSPCARPQLGQPQVMDGWGGGGGGISLQSLLAGRAVCCESVDGWPQAAAFAPFGRACKLGANRPQAGKEFMHCRGPISSPYTQSARLGPLAPVSCTQISLVAPAYLATRSSSVSPGRSLCPAAGRRRAIVAKPRCWPRWPSWASRRAARRHCSGWPTQHPRVGPKGKTNGARRLTLCRP